MAYEAKKTLMNEMERALASVVTVEQMAWIMSMLADTLSRYELIMLDSDYKESDDLLDAYVAALEVEGKSQKTIERYVYIIGRMRDAVRVPTRMITVYHLRKYLMDEKARGISDRTLEGTRQVFSAYFNWLQREGLIQTNPTANLGAVKYAKKIKDTYSETDTEKLKFLCKSVRDRAIVLFLASTGCRISEMTQLNRSDVDLSNLECTVLGKGNKERTVYLSPVAGMVLKEYLVGRTDNLDALFIGKRHERLTSHGVRAMLAVLSKRSGVDHVHPHKFRRTLATNLIRHGMPIQEVAAILGHDKLDTTMQYVVLDKTDVKNAYRKYA